MKSRLIYYSAPGLVELPPHPPPPTTTTTTRSCWTHPCLTNHSVVAKLFYCNSPFRSSKEDWAELFYNGIVGRNLGRHLLFCSQIPPHNAIRHEFGTSLFMNFGKANWMLTLFPFWSPNFPVLAVRNLGFFTCTPTPFYFSLL